MKTVPLLYQGQEAEITRWLKELHAATQNTRFVPFQELTDSEKQAAEVAVIGPCDPHDLKRLPNLKWVQSLWAGVDALADSFRHSNIPVVRMTDPALADTMAEAALTWSLYFHRDFHRYAQAQAEKQWQPLPYKPASETQIQILGFGKLGQRCAKVLKDHGFQVAAWKRSSSPTTTGVPVVTGHHEFLPFVAKADILINLLPLTDETRGLINEKTLAHMKPTAVLMNFGRGATLDDTAVLKALNENKLAAAVLDVFTTEPLPKEHPYWQHPNVHIMPHVSAPTRPDTASLVVAENLERFWQHGEIPEAVDWRLGY